MQKTIIILVLPLLLCVSSWAQQTNILNSNYSVSPKLRQFIIDHPLASKLLTNILAEAFSNRTVQLYYFYSDDKSLAACFHYYPSESVVGICINENQQPVDEFSSFIFEALNSEGEKRFQELSRRAESGDISRADYATEIMKVEFIAVKRTHDLLSNLKLSAKETSEAPFYKHFLECPSKFEDFLAYTKKISSPERDSIKEYEAQYDQIRKAQQQVK